MNEAAVKRAVESRNRGCGTEFEGKAIKMAALAGGLGKKKAYQKLLRDYGSTKTPLKCVLKQIYEFACEQAGVAQGAPEDTGAGEAASAASASVAIAGVLGA
jgi:hypothetical protein